MSPKRKRILALVFGLALAFAAAARADVIYQPGGGKIVGEIVEEKEDYVAIKTRAGGVLKIPRDEIDKIEKGPLPPAPPPPVAPPPPPPPSTEAASAPAPAAAPKPPPASVPKAAPAAPLGPAPTFGVDEEMLVKPRERAVLEWFERRREEIRVRLAPLVKQRRKEALDFINDPRKYPDENHGAAAQPEVDRLVGLLRRAYEDPFGELFEVNAELQRLIALLEEVAEADHVRAKVNKALSYASAAVEEREAARVVNEFNAKVTQDPEERACVDATNRYRQMFGLRLLKADERLIRAARKHSQAMVEREFFDHNSPVPGSETPERRVAAEGATYSAENIAMGSPEGEGAFRQWYNSSGHHRNMLGDHLTIGIGRYEKHWTENFGKDNLKN